MMTKQEIFNKAILGLMAQGRLGWNETGGCSYTAGCALGQLMTDEQRIKFDDGFSYIDTVIRKFPEDTLLQELSDEIEFCTWLQQAHDNARSFEDFFKKAKQLATNYNLTFPGEVE